MAPLRPQRSCQRLLAGRGLAIALLAALALAQLPAAAAVKAISSWNSGIITHFGGAQDGMNPSSASFGTKDGACGFGSIPKDKYPYFSTAALAPSNQFYKSDELHGCGQCFQVQCADDRSRWVARARGRAGAVQHGLQPWCCWRGLCKTDSAGKPLSIAVMISDECPECGSDHIDVQSLAFAKAREGWGIGRIKVQYRRIECTPPDDMKVSVMDFTKAGGWLRLVIDTTGGRAAVKSVSVKGSNTDWQPLSNSWGATWEMPSAPQPPLSFKIVGDDGEEVVATDVIKQSGGISNGANGPRTTFSAGVQFSISDPAFGKVTAFDGQTDPMLITSDTPGADDSGTGGGGNGTASSGGNSTSGNSTSSSSQQQGECKDVPAPGSYSCQQQKDWGKCYEGWFEPYCQKTCGRCGPNASAPQPGCSDVPTPDSYSCQQQKDWGKCDQSFIKDNGYCKATCGACSGGQPEVQAYNGPSDSSPSPSPSPGGRRLSAGGRRLLR
ncbi:hypothetical protein COHA_004303 [Chlorella ohadii]|uniref:Uncharacterized protein n=1 Tax=Chlorella ohadii TaxID=2649997 RepID=A0AAD5DTG8_9CHLO|nr:hypothetical protein COHA_004303 [Chlorella ohadii]